MAKKRNNNDANNLSQGYVLKTNPVVCLSVFALLFNNNPYKECSIIFGVRGVSVWKNYYHQSVV